MHSKLSKLYIVPGVLVGLILAIAATSMAEEDELDSDPRAIPYNGILEFNGEVLSGNADLQFTISDDLDPTECSFTEEHDNVPVYAGRFSVNIGSVTASGVDGCVFDTDAVYITIGVREADANDDMDDTNDAYTELSGRQRIRPVPFSYWSAEGSNFKIDGNANIGGTVSVGADLSVGTAEGNAVLNVQGATESSGLDRPHFRAGQFTVDSEDGGGLVNLVAGASGTTSGNHLYNDTRGASRIKMGDGDLTFYTGSEDGEADSEVSWAEVLYLDASSMTIVGDISNDSGDVTIADNLDITGNIQDTNGDVIINDSLDVTGDFNVNGDISNDSGNVTIVDNLDITGNIRDTGGAVVVNDSLQVNDDLVVDGDIDSVGNITLTAKIYSEGELFSMLETPVIVSPNNNDNAEALIPASAGFCALSVVAFDDGSTGSNTCSVSISGNSWVLTATGDSGPSACAANCFYWTNL